jgi:hypothetical protein
VNVLGIRFVELIEKKEISCIRQSRHRLLLPSFELQAALSDRRFLSPASNHRSVRRALNNGIPLPHGDDAQVGFAAEDVREL